MKYRYTLKITEDTNDADYINEETDLGVFDDTVEKDMKKIVSTMIMLSNFELDYGSSSMNMPEFLKDCKTYGVLPSDVDEDYKEYDYLVEYEATSKLPEGYTSDKADSDTDELNDGLCGIVSDWEPWMDNCDNNHSFDFEITRIPADVAVEDVYLDEGCKGNVLKAFYCEARKDDDEFDEFNDNLDDLSDLDSEDEED